MTTAVSGPAFRRAPLQRQGLRRPVQSPATHEQPDSAADADGGIDDPMASDLRDPDVGGASAWADFDCAGSEAHTDADAVADADTEADAFVDADLSAGAITPQAQATCGRAQRAGEPDDASLQALVERIVDRDESALAALYDAAGRRVYGLALRITRHAALAEEVVEDTFWQVWRQAPRFEAGRGRVVAWLLAMARSRAIDALRRDERFQHADLPAETCLEDAAEAARPAHDLLEATRGERRVHAALAALEPRSRQLVALAFFRGLTHEEIAAQAAMPLGTVKSLIRRALQQLRLMLIEEGGREHTLQSEPAAPDAP